MRRRSFIASASCVILATSLPSSAAAQSDASREFEIFERLGSLYRRLREFGNAWADDINEIRFTRFLNGVQDPLNDILHQKQTVLLVLESGNCAGERLPLRRVARQAAMQIGELLGVLGEKMRVLSSAIKPNGLRAEAAALGDSLADLRERKMWIEQVEIFCQMSAADRERFLANVRASVELVKRARNQLNELLDKLA